MRKFIANPLPLVSIVIFTIAALHIFQPVWEHWSSNDKATNAEIIDNQVETEISLTKQIDIFVIQLKAVDQLTTKLLIALQEVAEAEKVGEVSEDLVNQLRGAHQELKEQLQITARTGNSALAKFLQLGLTPCRSEDVPCLSKVKWAQKATGDLNYALGKINDLLLELEETDRIIHRYET